VGKNFNNIKIKFLHIIHCIVIIDIYESTIFLLFFRSFGRFSPLCDVDLDYPDYNDYTRMISHLFDANEHGDGGEKQDEKKTAKKNHELRKKETEKQEVLVQRGMMDFMKNLLYSSFFKK